jgi:hypothetical protein
MPSIEKFLKQDRNELCPYEKALEQLAVIVHGPNRANPGEYVDGQNLSA